MITRRRIGFRPRHPVLYRSYNIVVAGFLIAALLPLLGLIAGLLFATQGRGIIYRGERLGKDRRVFHILKFRTLDSDKARRLTRDRTLPHDARIETPLGAVLRETRLDELPQLFNILMGDMNICGPRPVRAEIAAIERERIPGYDDRFLVKPGLVGPAQAYFGHGTSKRIRARMNNVLVRRQVDVIAEIALFSRIGLAIVARALRKSVRAGASLVGAPVRETGRDILVVVEGSNRIAVVERIGLRSITIPGLVDLPANSRATLYIRLHSGGLRKARIALCEEEKRGLFSYTAETELGEFMIERYALGMVVVPRRVGAPPIEAEIHRPVGVQPA